jgi:hypothetical protein
MSALSPKADITAAFENVQKRTSHALVECALEFAQSVSGQHGQPKYLSRRAVVIGKRTKELKA